MNAMLDDSSTNETLLEVNNIEVIYNHVILVLKGRVFKCAKRRESPRFWAAMARVKPRH
jgi:hypothetical protein